MELVPVEIRHSTIVSSPQENFAGCTFCMYVVYSPSHPAAPSKMELAGFTFGCTADTSLAFRNFQRRREREGKQARREREKISVTTCDNCTFLLTFRALRIESWIWYTSSRLWSLLHPPHPLPHASSCGIHLSGTNTRTLNHRRSARSDAGSSAHSSVMCFDTI